MNHVHVLLLLGAVACGRSIQPEFNAARDRALADPGPAPASWTADAVVQVSAPVVEDVIEAATREQGPLSTALELGLARVEPTLRLTSLAVVPSRPCEGGCVGVDAAFAGSVAWTVGPLSGKTPVSAHGAMDVVLEVAEEGRAFVVTAAPARLRDLEVEVGDLDASIKGIKRSIRTLVQDELLARVQPLSIARFPRSALPVRAARVSSEGSAVRIELLTAVPTPGVATAGPPPAEGFAIALAEDSLLALARAEAFRNGPVGYGVVPEPTALSFTDRGFTLGLRLWRIEGVGWWRDYTITGTAQVAGGKLKLAPGEVVEGEKSRGATLADPLAALAQGLILKTIEDAVNQTLPLASTQDVGRVSAKVVLGALAPSAGTVRGTGTVRLGGR